MCTMVLKAPLPRQLNVKKNLVIFMSGDYCKKTMKGWQVNEVLSRLLC